MGLLSFLEAMTEGEHEPGMSALARHAGGGKKKEEEEKKRFSEAKLQIYK